MRVGFTVNTKSFSAFIFYFLSVFKQILNTASQEAAVQGPCVASAFKFNSKGSQPKVQVGQVWSEAQKLSGEKNGVLA